MHHLIDKDGDGDWGAVWENLAEIGADLRTARARAAELEEDNAHLQNAFRSARGAHVGRAWHGHAIEDACPCPQEP
ncbi:MAG: hypothetical protein ACRDXB_20050, partial [Actinomycetes bacterium]